MTIPKTVARFNAHVTNRVSRPFAGRLPGFAVDTHVTRLTNRLGFVATKDPVKIEHQVCSMVPQEEWTALSLRLILHGRRICDARRPRCEECVLNDLCPSSLVRPRRRLRKGRPIGEAPGSDIKLASG